jgi:hypothetical protein
MELAKRDSPDIRGREEMHALVRETFGALNDADLYEVAQELRDRVLGREPDELLDTELEDGACRWTFKPMVELMFRHLIGIASNAKMPEHERRLEIAATIEFAGF